MEVSGYYQYQLDEQGKGPPRPSTSHLLGPAQRLTVSCALLVGLLTFFLPTINTNPPVLERHHWSLLSIISEIQNGHLPEGLTSFLPMILVLYFLMLADFIGLFISRRLSAATLQATFALIEVWIWAECRFSSVGDRKHDLERFFYYGRNPTGNVTFGYGTHLLLVMILAIFVISIAAPSRIYRKPK